MRYAETSAGVVSFVVGKKKQRQLLFSSFLVSYVDNMSLSIVL